MNDLVSVIISVFNENKEMLKKSISSIRNQTYKYLEIIIIDDGCSSECKEYIKYVEKEDNRVKVITHEKNIGLTMSLNEGLSIAKGTYIARMDGDDISLPKRIEQQISFLEKNPEIDIVGTGVISFGRESIFYSPPYGYEPDEVEIQLLFTSSLCHPSVMFRKKFIEKNKLGYDENVKKAQDYELWERSSLLGKLAVMPDVLLLYRTHEHQISHKNSDEQVKISTMVMKRRLKRVGLKITDYDLKCHRALKGEMGASVIDTELWVRMLIEANYKREFLNQDKLRKNLNERLLILKLKTLISTKSFAKAKLNPIDYYRLLVYIKNRTKMQIKLLYLKLRLKKFIN